MNGKEQYCSLVSFLLVFATCEIAAGEKNALNRTSLHLLTFLPFPTSPGALLAPSFDFGCDLISAVRVALRIVNGRRDLLRGYRLEAIFADGGCDVTSATYVSFAKQVFGEASKDRNTVERRGRRKKIAGVIGPLCSASAEVVSKLTGRSEIAFIQLHSGGFAPSGGEYGGREEPYSFSIRTPDTVLNEAVIAFMRRLEWKRVAVLYDPGTLFYHKLYENFVRQTTSDEIGLVEEIFSARHIPKSISSIRKSLLRVVVVFVGPVLASNLLTLAYSSGLVYPHYQFVIMAASVLNIPQKSRKIGKHGSLGANDKVVKALEGALLIQNILSAVDVNRTTDVGISFNEFHKLYSKQLHKDQYQLSMCKSKLRVSLYGAVAFDMVWAFSLALNTSISTLKDQGIELSSYGYGMPHITDILSREIIKLKFEGLSGPIDFKSEGFSSRAIKINRMAIEQGRPVFQQLAEYKLDNLTILSQSEIDKVLPDSFPHENEVLHLGFTVMAYIVTLLHLLLLVATHILMIIYRNRRSIKASSTRLNHFIYTGSYLITMAIILNVLLQSNFHNDRKSSAILCQAIWPWAISIGMTLIFGTIIVRTWRIYRIFIHFVDPGRFISNTALTLILFALLSVDFVIAILWTAIDSFHVEILSEKQKNHNQEIIVEEVSMCVSEYLILWLFLIMAYKILLLVVMFALAFLTRRVKDKDFSTKNLRIASYFLTLVTCLGFPLYCILFLARVDQLIDFTLLIILLNILVFFCDLFVLFPPLLPVLKQIWIGVQRQGVKLKPEASCIANDQRQTSNIILCNHNTS